MNSNSELLENAGEISDQYNESGIKVIENDEKIEVIESDVKVEVIDIDQTQIIGKKRKRSEIEISENEFIFCEEEYLEELNDKKVKIDESKNPVSTEV